MTLFEGGSRCQTKSSVGEILVHLGTNEFSTTVSVQLRTSSVGKTEKDRTPEKQDVRQV